MKKLTPFYFLAFFSLMIIACNSDEPAPKKNAQLSDGQPKFEKEGELTFYTAENVEIVKINIEVADDDAQRQMGLMNRSFMGNDQGMLFIFNKEERQAFWMHNTIIPLDIIYVNSNKEIVSIVEDATPFSDQSLPSKGPAIYVVEVNAGFCAQYGIKAKSKIEFDIK